LTETIEDEPLHEIVMRVGLEQWIVPLQKK
jgi:hypothetical protein